MTVVITGASRGIGRELINFFLEKKGVKVIGLSTNPSKLHPLEKRTRNFKTVHADLSSPEGVLKAAQAIGKLSKQIDVVVNNAGFLVNKPFSAITPIDFERSYRVNVMAPFLLTQHLLPFMHKKNRAHIVNIGSMGGFQGSAKFGGLSAYSTSKGALSVMSECLAEELKDKNISVNCLCLGAVNTEMLNAAFPGYKAPTSAKQMAHFIGNFALTGHHSFNGKVLPVSISTP